MLQSEFEALKNGDKVVFNNWHGFTFHSLETGDILTRKETWMDDESTVGFEFTDKQGSDDWHFFSAEEISSIEE